MKRTQKYWTLNFCEENYDGLLRCYRHGGTTGYRLLWENLSTVRSVEALDEQGIYFVIERGNIENKCPRIYIGQGSKRKNQKAMLNRVKEHKRNGEFEWADDVVLVRTPDSFGATELNYLEHKFHELAQKAKRYDTNNKVKPHNGVLREEIVGLVDDFIEDTEDILAIFGHRPFMALKQEESAPQEQKCEVADKQETLICKGSGAEAQAVKEGEGLRVLMGSKVSKTICESFKKTAAYQQRLNLMKEKVIVGRVFEKDYVFDSLSAASSIVLGRPSSGPRSWKTKQ